MGTFRLCHISDLHFGKISGRVNPLEGLEGRKLAAEAMRILLNSKGNAAHALYPSTYDANVALDLRRVILEELDDVDALIATGDLATTGENADLARAQSFFTSAQIGWLLPAEAPAPLESVRFPIYVMPGNHDRYEGVTKIPLSGRFESHFGTHWDFDKNRSYVIGGADPRIRTAMLVRHKEGVALAILFADFTLEAIQEAEFCPSPWGYIGQGRAKHSLVHELKRCTRVALAEASNAGFLANAIWAIHFPPGFPNIDSRLKLLDEQHVIEAAHECGVEVILSGHTHQSLSYQIAGTRLTVLCSGASAGVGPEPNTFSFSIVDIDPRPGGGTLAKATNYLYDARSGAFEEAASE